MAKAAKKQVNAPAVIIAPEHQSAPNMTPHVNVTSAPEPRPFGTSDWLATNPTTRWQTDVINEFGERAVAKPVTQDFDTELDMPQYHDPRMLEQLIELERRDRINPTEQMIEEALRQHEMSAQDERVKRSRWAGQERWQGRENEAMRLVRIMHPHTFMEKLRRAGVAACVDADEKGSPRRARLWLNSWSRAGRVGVNAWAVNQQEQRLEVQTITSLQYPFGPEWSIMRFDEWNVPTNERYRGWRTVLLALIMARVITEEEADRAFGKPVGVASLFYREQLFNQRKIWMGLAPQVEAL